MSAPSDRLDMRAASILLGIALILALAFPERVLRLRRSLVGHADTTQVAGGLPGTLGQVARNALGLSPEKSTAADSSGKTKAKGATDRPLEKESAGIGSAVSAGARETKGVLESMTGALSPQSGESESTARPIATGDYPENLGNPDGRTGSPSKRGLPTTDIDPTAVRNELRTRGVGGSVPEAVGAVVWFLQNALDDTTRARIYQANPLESGGLAKWLRAIEAQPDYSLLSSDMRWQRVPGERFMRGVLVALGVDDDYWFVSRESREASLRFYGRESIDPYRLVLTGNVRASLRRKGVGGTLPEVVAAILDAARENSIGEDLKTRIFVPDPSAPDGIARWLTVLKQAPEYGPLSSTVRPDTTLAAPLIARLLVWRGANDPMLAREALQKYKYFF